MLRVDRSESSVVTLTIDRPEKRNAVNTETLAAIENALRQAAADGQRCVVLTGADGVFSAGADLSGVEGPEFRTQLVRTLTLLDRTPLVTLAAIDGFCLGAGLQLASFCDLRVATPAARFGIPAAKLGIAVDIMTVDRVAVLCGGGAARAILLAAEVIDGEKAATLGLVQRIGDLESALGWANQIARLAPLTIQAHKAAFTQCASGPRDLDHTRAAEELFRAAWQSTDAQEGQAAFRERRKPRFTGS